MSDISPVRDTAQTKSTFIEEFLELIRYRDLVVQMVRRDIVTRYKRSLLGVGWTMLSPLGMMIILSVVFSQIMPTQPGYPAYILSGLVAWNFFAQATTVAMSYLVDGGGLLRSIYVPPSVFVISAIGTGLANLILSLLPLLFVTVIVGIPIQPVILFLPVPIFLLVCFTSGIGLIVSTFGVFFRDTNAIYQLILTAWIYLCPVFFPEYLLDSNFSNVLWFFNPMYVLIRLFRMPVFDGYLPSPSELFYGTFIALSTLIIGWIIFTRKCDEFTYRI